MNVFTLFEIDYFTRITYQHVTGVLKKSKQLEEAQALIKNDSSDLFNEIRMTLLISLPELINHG